MTLKASEVKKLLALGRKLELKSLKVGEFEAHFFVRHQELRRQESEPQVPSKVPIGLESGMPTDDEMLYYSTDYASNIKAEKPD